MKVLSFITSVAFLMPAKACFTEHIARASQIANANDCAAVSQPTSTFAIANVKVFDGAGFGTPQTVVVNGDKILAVGGAPMAFLDAQSVDGTGKYLIPGLIESHVHPQNCSNLADLASYGVTTAINMACLNYTTCNQLKGQLGTADYITAGEIACGNGSLHASSFGVPARDTVKPDTDLRALVDYTFGNGSNFFKIIAEANGPTTDQQTKLVQFVHEQGSFAATHATALEFYAQAIESKVDGIQHTPPDGILSDAQVNQILSQGQFVTPTMEFYRIAFSNPTLKSALGFDSSSNYTNVQQNVANMHKAGIPIAAGTDAVGNIPGLVDYPFGRTLHCELQNLVDAGFKDAEALNSATSSAAKLHRLSDRGTIATGMRADLLLLNSNPISNIENSLDINAAWVGGVEIKNIAAQKGQTCDPTSPDF